MFVNKKGTISTIVFFSIFKIQIKNLWFNHIIGPHDYQSLSNLIYIFEMSTNVYLITKFEIYPLRDTIADTYSVIYQGNRSIQKL